MENIYPLSVFLLLVLNPCILPKAGAIYAEENALLDRLPARDLTYFVLITDNNENHLCTGTIISKNHAITAASCLEAVSSLADLRVIYGSRDTKSPFHGTFRVSKKTTYESWCNNQILCFYERYTDDLSILQLDTEDSGIKPAMIGKYTPEAGDPITMFGWGSLVRTPKPKSLRRASLTILDRKFCEERVRKLVPKCFSDVTLPPKLSCAATEPAILGVNGDFGGPVRKRSARYFFGILIQRCPKFSVSDFNPKQVNLILHLADFQNFINDIVGPETLQ